MMDRELHLSQKDFNLEWFSGSGGGGQHRNKHQNCCRITHNDTGISAIGTVSKSRVVNQKTAFAHLAARLIAHYKQLHQSGVQRREDGERVRTYHAERNEVLDHASGLTMRYSDVVGKGNIGPMIEARKHVAEVDLADDSALQSVGAEFDSPQRLQQADQRDALYVHLRRDARKHGYLLTKDGQLYKKV